MTEFRILKKYPNRRLYDTVTSAYVTLDHVKQWVVEGVPLKVVEVRTDKDVTQLCLLQIILEQTEQGPGQAFLSTEILQNIIRLYANSNLYVNTVQDTMKQTFDFFQTLCNT
jgi:polyhydroxyalkanoate synthesis repressor PhaR